MTTWWQEHDTFARANRSGHDQTLAPHLVELLDDVETRFVAAGGAAMSWADPHATPGRPWERRDPTEAEYSRLANPGKYAIVEVRMNAWVAALTAPLVSHDIARNDTLWNDGAQNAEAGTPGPLALLTEHDVSAETDPSVHREAANDPAPSRVRTLTSRDGGASLHVTSWTHDAERLSFQVAAGEPAAVALTTPVCGCDACDSGSDELLREVDQWILSVVDGSFEISERGEERMDRTSFGGGIQWAGDARYAPDLHVVGRSWWPGCNSRPLVDLH